MVAVNVSPLSRLRANPDSSLVCLQECILMDEDPASGVPKTRSDDRDCAGTSTPSFVANSRDFRPTSRKHSKANCSSLAQCGSRNSLTVIIWCQIRRSAHNERPFFIRMRGVRTGQPIAGLHVAWITAIALQFATLFHCGPGHRGV